MDIRKILMWGAASLLAAGLPEQARIARRKTVRAMFGGAAEKPKHIPKEKWIYVDEAEVEGYSVFQSSLTGATELRPTLKNKHYAR